MSGIAGIAHRQGVGAVPREAVERMCASLRHRGPDHRGIHVAEGIGLGAQRLGIIDPGGSNQPIFNEDGTKAIVFDGEIYNYRDLRRELMTRGHVFRTAGDAETILHLYEDSGQGCIDRLRGMFAFAIWDANARALFLARDRFGMKPLYLVRAPWGMAFASELKALQAAGMDLGGLDLEALDTYVQLGYVPAPATPFRGVKKLEPGHCALWRENGEVTVRRYWDLPEDTDDTLANPEARVLEWLDESVTSHLVSDVPVTVLMSGGLDSAAVLSSMAGTGQVSEAFTAHCGVDHGEDLDEVHLNAGAADRYGIRLTVVDTDNVVSSFEDIVYALDEPHADESASCSPAVGVTSGSS
jgi:asparagine synthase (glutamine-hydrolysing)